MYCSQGDQRFSFLLNRFWAAPPFSSLLASSPYKSSLQEAKQKTGEKVRLCLKFPEQKCLIQTPITMAEILCCQSCSMHRQAAGEPGTRLQLRSWSGRSQHITEKPGLCRALPEKVHQEPIRLPKNSHRVFTRKAKTVKPACGAVSSYIQLHKRITAFLRNRLPRAVPYMTCSVRQRSVRCLSLPGSQLAGWQVSTKKQRSDR